MRREEEGAAVVEFTVVAFVFLMIIFGIIEGGLAMRDQSTVATAATNAARVGAAMGIQEEADHIILQEIASSLSALPNAGLGIVKYVHIYEARADGEPKSTCGFGGGGIGGAACNVYEYRPGFLPGCDWDPCPDPSLSSPPTLGGGWGDDFGIVAPGTPPERDVELPELDVLGVRIYYSHRWVTGGLLPLPDTVCDSPPNNCWADTALFRLEPAFFRE